MTPALRFYGHLLLRRAPVMLFLILVCSAAGLFVAAGMPTTYISQARMLVQGQEISEALAESTVQIAELEEIEILREQLMTRENLIEIAHRFQVFPEIDRMTPDEVVFLMREATDIDASGGSSRTAGPRPALMTISFRARTGQIAADVVNDYVTRITATNVQLRVNQADQTLAFFQRQVERLSAELATRSERITAFQTANADALPSDQDFRLQRQALLQERIAAAERERSSLVETRQRTIQIFESGATPQANLPPDQQLLQSLQAELDTLLLTFSDSAAQVQALRRRIELLEAQIATQAPTGAETEATEGTTDPVAPLLALQLAEIDSRMTGLNAVIDEANAELDRLNAAISQAPRNAIELDRLQREYSEIQVQYDNASRSLAQAAIGEQLERGGRGQRITLLEPPVVPSSPASPNRRIIAAAGGAIGIGLAAALFVLLELLNRSVRRPAELVKALGMSPFATLPYIDTARSRMWRRAMQVSAVVAVLAGVPAGLWAVNEFYMPLDQLSERLLDSLGLA